MEHPLPRSRPTEHGVAPSGIGELVDALEQLPGVEPHSLMVLRHGAVVAEGWWAPYGPDRAHLLYSLSKSFTSTALGLAVGEGRVRLDDPVLDHFPELDAAIRDERTRRLRVRHLASMASGHVDDTWNLGPSTDATSPVRSFLLLPPDEEPGTVFAYNQSATYTLATIVQRVTGRTVNDYLQDRLLGPIGAGPTSWYQQPPGQDVGFSGLHAMTETVALLGQLYLRHGRLAGRAYLPQGWAEEASRAHVATSPRAGTGEVPSPDWGQGYGFQFWRSRHGYRGDGAYGQFCLVLPEQDAVVAMTGQSADMQAVLDAVWGRLLPAFDRQDASAGRDEARLEERLATLGLAPLGHADSPPGGAAPWLGRRLVPAAAGAALGPALGKVVVDDGGGSWQLVVEQDGDRLRVPLGPRWSEAEWEGGGAPVVSSGGWVDGSVLEADLVFLESPHRLQLRCSLPEGTVVARWATAPLHPRSLRAMCSPATWSPPREPLP